MGEKEGDGGIWRERELELEVEKGDFGKFQGNSCHDPKFGLDIRRRFSSLSRVFPPDGHIFLGLVDQHE